MRPSAHQAIRGIVSIAAVLVVIVLASCSSPGHSAAPGGSHTASSQASTTNTAGGGYAVTGQATASGDVTMAGVVVGFQPTGNCGACSLRTAVTGSGGAYSLALPAGTYQVECSAGSGRTCLIATSPPTAAARLSLTAPISVNLVVSTSAAPPAPAPVPTQVPAGGSGDVVTGHVLTSGGQAVPNADITFRMADCADCTYQPHAETGPDGSYSITLQPGVYNAECDVIGICGAAGTSGGGVPVNIPPGGTLNFIVCPSDTQFPECAQG